MKVTGHIHNFLILILSISCFIYAKNTKALATSNTLNWKTIQVSEKDSFPSITLKNDSISVLFYLPQKNKGFYRGSRFDWSGMIGKVTHGEHTYYGHWDFWPHNPENPEHAIGPAEEFDIDNAQQFSNANDSVPFTKIGVGRLLKKPEHKNYFFNTPYHFASHADWSVSACSTGILFTQNLPPQKGLVSYSYQKKITLAGSNITIHHSLKNTSKDTLRTRQFNHNITIIDNDSIGETYRAILGFTPTITESLQKACGTLNAISGDTVLFLRKFGGNASGLNFGAPQFRDPKCFATVVNTKTKGAVTIGGNYKISNFVLWSRTAICPEPFIDLVIPPGKSVEWEFYLRYWIVL